MFASTDATCCFSSHLCHRKDNIPLTFSLEKQASRVFFGSTLMMLLLYLTKLADLKQANPPKHLQKSSRWRSMKSSSNRSILELTFVTVLFLNKKPTSFRTKCTETSPKPTLDVHDLWSLRWCFITNIHICVSVHRIWVRRSLQGFYELIFIYECDLLMLWALRSGQHNRWWPRKPWDAGWARNILS